MPEVTQQVLQQQLHRQEGQKGADHPNGQHITEVGAGGRAAELRHVAEGRAAFHHAVVQHQQARFQQDDVHRTVHIDIDVGRAQGWGVVDAIALEAHAWPLGRKARTMRSVCRGVSWAKMVCACTAPSSASSLSVSTYNFRSSCSDRPPWANPAGDRPSPSPGRSRPSAP